MIRLALLFISLCLFGCASYQSNVGGARNLIAEGRFSEAAEQLRPLAEKESDDQLVYLLDYGTALHLAGRYIESNQAFLKADKLAEIQDYHSISKVTGSLLFAEEMVQYKGEDFENIMINAYLAMNFLMMGDINSAQVEARRMNEKLRRLKLEGDRDFAESPFATYLSAIIWEANRSYDDAYIDYETTFKLAPGYLPLEEDLVRGAMKARREDSKRSWERKFPNVREQTYWKSKIYGELVFIYQQGWGPRKDLMRGSYNFPKLYPNISETQKVRVEVKGEGKYESTLLYNVEQVAIRSLESQYGQMVAKKVGAIATKAIVADQIRQKNALLGDVAWIAMNLTDRADVRQWSTLPQTLHMIRIPLHEGKYTMNIQGLTYNGNSSGDQKENVEFEIKAGKKTFYTWRSLR